MLKKYPTIKRWIKLSVLTPKIHCSGYCFRETAIQMVSTLCSNHLRISPFSALRLNFNCLYTAEKSPPQQPQAAAWQRIGQAQQFTGVWWGNAQWRKAPCTGKPQLQPIKPGFQLHEPYAYARTERNASKARLNWKTRLAARDTHAKACVMFRCIYLLCVRLYQCCPAWQLLVLL